MCGICGIYNFTEEPTDEQLVRSMMGRIIHRGPDDEGFVASGPVALGQRRLSIIDLATGHQPLSNEDQTVWITYNGEIYNFHELMDNLLQRGHRFRTQSDTEAIVYAYEEYGLECFSRLNGMYAFALWDGRAKRLLLARDPFGVKPLYVWQNSRRLLFASEIKAFFADPDFLCEVDKVALDEYLSFQFVPSPRTIFKGVQKLQPGHCLVVEGDRARLVAFARKVPAIREVKSEAQAVAELEELLVTAIKRQMISDVPVGAMLSGGVDSATVVALMRQVTGQPIKTFTVGFDGGFAKDELATARRSAEILGTEHHEIVIGAREYLDSFAATLWHLDEPVATSSAPAMYWVSRLASEHVKVVLTGQGADEPWAGYRRYRGEKLGAWYRRLPVKVRREVIAPAVKRLPRADASKRAIYALGSDDAARRFRDMYAVFTPEMKRALCRDGLAEVESASPPAGEEILEYWRSPVAHLDSVAQQLYVETRFSLPDNLLLYSDKVSMASSLEARVPLLDLELMNFVESLPSNMRLRGLTGHKYLYRKAIARWLPKEILRRPKVGFATPMDEWFQREITGYVRERLTAAGSACDNFFNLNYVDTLIAQHAARHEDHTRALFCLLTFEGWYEQFIGCGQR